MIGVDAKGNFVVAWESSGQDGSGNGVYYRRYDKNFNPLSDNEIVITTNTAGDQWGVNVAVEPGGRFIIVWSDNNNRDGGGGSTQLAGPGASVWMREFDANGNAVGSETMVNQSVTGYQGYTVADINASGKFVVAWDGNGTLSGNIDDMGIFARSYLLSQTGTSSISVSPASATTSDLVTITMTLTNPTSIANVIPNTLSVSGTNGVFATLVSGPIPASATVGTSPVTFTWTYIITAVDASGVLTFGGNVRGNGGAIFPYATSNSVSIKPSFFIVNLTSPNLINDANNSNAGPKVFSLGAKITNAGLSTLTNVNIKIGDSETPGSFPVTTMTLTQTNNTYQGDFSLQNLAGNSDCSRFLDTLKPARTVIAGMIDFDGNGIINSSDNGTLSNGKKVIAGRIDVDLNGVINTNDDLARPPGVFTGYRSPGIIDGYVDVNNDGVINAADNGTYGGETKVVYWQIRYAVLDAFGQPTFGNCGLINDDLRYKWVTWATANDGGTTRTHAINEFTNVRCDQSTATNKISPGPNGYISGGPPHIIAGKVDINSDGVITTSDDGTFYGKTVIDGRLDMDNNGVINTADDGAVYGYQVIDGYVDINGSGTISSADDGIIVFPGNTFSVTIHNATFGNVGNGFDENRDNLWDYDFWYQPTGDINWPAASFRLVDIQCDVTGSGGSNPLNGITSHYDNEPYLSRLIGDIGGVFNANYTYTFLYLQDGNGFISPYQQAASGTNNEKARCQRIKRTTVTDLHPIISGIIRKQMPDAMHHSIGCFSVWFIEQ